MSVYFITCREIGMVKIGCSIDPFVRMKTLQTAFPLDLNVEALFQGANRAEKAFHQRFAKHRVRGEWFRLCDEIETLIANSEAPKRPKSQAQRRRLYAMHDEPDMKAIPRAGPSLVEPSKPLPSPRVSRAFDERFLTKANRRRIAEGDIHFPFRSHA